MPISAIASTETDRFGRGYPRPQLRRREWYSLDGEWEFALDPSLAWSAPAEVAWASTIRVPFAPEAPLSGVNTTGFFRGCWYKRRVALPAIGPRERWVLHFGAVDTTATVWIDGAYVGRHDGGYTPFHFDVTPFVSSADCEIVVRAEDDPADLAKPRGKQDWQLEPHSIWYPRTSGIWQTVWLERVPATRIGRLA